MSDDWNIADNAILFMTVMTFMSGGWNIADNVILFVTVMTFYEWWLKYCWQCYFVPWQWWLKYCWLWYIVRDSDIYERWSKYGYVKVDHNSDDQNCDDTDAKFYSCYHLKKQKQRNTAYARHIWHTSRLLSGNWTRTDTLHVTRGLGMSLRKPDSRSVHSSLQKKWQTVKHIDGRILERERKNIFSLY